MYEVRGSIRAAAKVINLAASPDDLASSALLHRRFTLDSPTGAALNVYRTEPGGAPRSVLLVQHGLAEHAGRYARFAAEMAAAGHAVYAHDHRGHGSTSAVDAPLRRFAKAKGPAKLLADSHAVQGRAAAEHPDVPVIVFGHSLGGIIALNYAERHGSGIAGVAAWNVNLTMGLQERLAIAALGVERALKGSDVASAVFRRATIDAWGRSIVPRRSMSDWLSHDPAAVAAFESDPLCGWSPTVSMAADIVELVREAGSEARLGELPPDLPIHLLGGTEDPATAEAETVMDLAGRLRLSGCRDVTTDIVKGARHETLHETEELRAEGLASLNRWIDRLLDRH